MIFQVPPYFGKTPKFSRFLIMMPPLRMNYAIVHRLIASWKVKFLHGVDCGLGLNFVTTDVLRASMVTILKSIKKRRQDQFRECSGITPALLWGKSSSVQLLRQQNILMSKSP